VGPVCAGLRSIPRRRSNKGIVHHFALPQRQTDQELFPKQSSTIFVLRFAQNAPKDGSVQALRRRQTTLDLGNGDAVLLQVGQQSEASRHSAIGLITIDGMQRQWDWRHAQWDGSRGIDKSAVQRSVHIGVVRLMMLNCDLCKPVY